MDDERAVFCCTSFPVLQPPCQVVTYHLSGVDVECGRTFAHGAFWGVSE